MSPLKQYVADAIRTESHISRVQSDIPTLIVAMQAYVAAGNMLDDIKKNVFYGKEINPEKWSYQLQELKLAEQKIPAVLVEQSVAGIDINPRLFHAIIGIATESTELVEAVLKSIETGIDIDNVNVKEEMFDLLWYILIGHDALGSDMEATLDMGFEKLRKRYPEKFTVDNAIHRDLVAEREILESHSSS
jgi:NTP pyrophosphatase (non-canonical NTP hydrolase)